MLGIVAFCAPILSQSNTFDPTNTRDGETVEYCLTHKKQAELMANPAAAASFAQDEIIRQQEALMPIPKATVWRVPIVFHILHNGGNEDISKEQILDALYILNRDYRLQNSDANNVHADFQGLPADVEIEFVMATKAPNGTCFSGVTRTQHILATDGSDGGAQVDAIIAGNDVYNNDWPGDKYLNVFVCGDVGNAAGYTTNPSNWLGNSMYNGIWIQHTYVGSIGTGNTNRSRALTHEVGHWLNLDHVWGPNNNPGNASSCNDDDGVNDTPNEIGVTSCSLNEMTCGPRANVENYMNYSYCSKMFTPGQVTRMRNALNSNVANRNNLKTNSNLIATGADGNTYLCKTDFSADKTTICLNDQVQFSDESYNNVSGWTWTFDGGNPGSSTSQNPLITYDTPGLYQVTLNATDGSNSDDEIKTSYIRVLAAPVAIPILEGFENFSTLNNNADWEVNNLGGSAEWELSSTVGLSSSKSAKLANFNQPVGSIDELASKSIDLSGVSTSMTLSFRYAYKRKNSSDNDRLRVQVTANCGDSWANRFVSQGSLLSTQTQSSAYTPSSDADWTTVHITNITNTYWTDKFRYKFLFEAGGGNNMYIDNINIYEGSPSDDLVVGLDELIDLSGVNVYPNPVDEELSVAFTLNNAQQSSLKIQDLSGKIMQQHIVNANAGSNTALIDTRQLAQGLYFLTINTGSAERTVQFVVK